MPTHSGMKTLKRSFIGPILWAGIAVALVFWNVSNFLNYGPNSFFENLVSTSPADLVQVTGFALILIGLAAFAQYQVRPAASIEQSFAGFSRQSEPECRLKRLSKSKHAADASLVVPSGKCGKGRRGRPFAVFSAENENDNQAVRM
jgi:hypothetical protein